MKAGWIRFFHRVFVLNIVPRCRAIVLCLLCLTVLMSCSTTSNRTLGDKAADTPSAALPFQNGSDAEFQHCLTDAYFFAQSKMYIQALPKWRISAKVGVVTSDTKQQATLVWKYENGTHYLRLFGPLGAGQVKLRFNQHEIMLTDSKGKQYVGQHAMNALGQATGLSIPIMALPYWVFALPYENHKDALCYQVNQSGQLSFLKQFGWFIQFDRYQPTGDVTLPKRVIVTKLVKPREIGNSITQEDITVTILIKQRKIDIKSTNAQDISDK